MLQQHFQESRGTVGTYSGNEILFICVCSVCKYDTGQHYIVHVDHVCCVVRFTTEPTVIPAAGEPRFSVGIIMKGSSSRRRTGSMMLPFSEHYTQRMKAKRNVEKQSQ